MDMDMDMDMDAEALGLPPVRQIDPVHVVTNGCRHVALGVMTRPCAP